FAQYLSMEVTPAVFEREIAPARTFVYYEDVEPLMEKNLIKGGSLENAIVVHGEAVLSKEPLRFADEFVRHKILDIIGDLALVGRRIRGHLVCRLLLEKKKKKEQQSRYSLTQRSIHTHRHYDSLRSHRRG